jgi:hypothetical protein
MEIVARIIYTGSFRFPDGDAGAARVLGIGKSRRAAGHEVIFAGWEGRGRHQDLRKNGYVYQDFSYIPQGDLPTTSRRSGIRLIVDCTEWYASQNLSGGKFGVPFLDNELRMRRLNVTVNRVELTPLLRTLG